MVVMAEKGTVLCFESAERMRLVKASVKRQRKVAPEPQGRSKSKSCRFAALRHKGFWALSAHFANMGGTAEVFFRPVAILSLRAFLLY